MSDRSALDLYLLVLTLTIEDEAGIPHTDEKIRAAGMALRESAIARAILGLDDDCNYIDDEEN